MSIKTAIFSFLLCKLIGLIVCSHRHVIIFDAGSTGTRLHLFEFDENFGQFNLTCGIYEETKPGLSAYAKDPEAIRQPLENLLSKAKDAIPESKWFKTPLSLGATAGLRLLPKNEAARILEVCRDVFLNSGFSVSDKSVSMLDESDEGIYCWITANYLLEKFSDESSAAWKKNAVFDLGGGSTQVTMAVSDDFVKNAAPDVQQNIHNLTIANRHLRIYTKSILGLGIMAARRQILCYPEKCLVRKKTVEVKSDCMMTNHSTALEWNYMGQTFKITGTEGPKKMLKCLAIVKQVVLQAMPENLPNFAIRRIIGTSYYVDRAVAAEAIKSKDGGDLYVDSFYKHANKFFNNPDDSQPFLGLELIYIYSLLHDGLKINDDVLMTVLWKVKDYEVDWALGNAIVALEDKSDSSF